MKDILNFLAGINYGAVAIIGGIIAFASGGAWWLTVKHYPHHPDHDNHKKFWKRTFWLSIIVAVPSTIAWYFLNH